LLWRVLLPGRNLFLQIAPSSLLALSRSLTRLPALCVAFCIAMIAQCSWAEVTVAIDGHTTSFDIARGVGYLVETTPLTVDQARVGNWQTVERQSINLHQQQQPVWFRFDVIAPAAIIKEGWLLEVQWPPLDFIELHVFDHGRKQWQQVQLGGNRVALAQRALLHRDYLFPLSLQAGQRYSIYLRISSLSHFVVPLTLWRADAFYYQDQAVLLLEGVLVGILGVMLIYNLFIFMFTADKSYFFYSIYVFCILYFVLSLSGLGSRYVWSDIEWLRRRSFVLSAALAYLAAAYFVRQFLSLKSYGGWIMNLYNVIAIFWIYAVASSFLADIIPQHPLLQVVDIAGALSAVIGLAATIYLWWRGNVSARYFTIAWGVLIVCNISFAMMLEGALDRNLFTVYGQQVGFVIEVVMLSLVLAERISRERAAREQAQIEALQMSQQFSDERDAKLAAQAQALAAQWAANEELEMRVMERTRDLEAAMQTVEHFNRELRELSITDALTGVHNRRHFEKTFDEELAQARRRQQPLSVIILDLDHFKRINDTYGHLVGDECLKLVAGALRQRLARAGDLVARYGGEEFAILLPATAQQDATQLADSLRVGIEQLELVINSQHIPLSASLGVAGWIPAAGESYEKLIGAADAALYQAKHRGRNCTVAAS